MDQTSWTDSIHCADMHLKMYCTVVLDIRGDKPVLWGIGLFLIRTYLPLRTECPKIYRKSVLHLLKRDKRLIADAVQICGNV
mgnify:CR=1 FL=1